MKFTVAYYLVLLYLTVMLKPLIPIINDAWSHEFNGLEHISLIHAKYGSNHLQKELADSSSDKGGAKTQNTLKSEDQVSFHVVQQTCKYRYLLKEIDIEYLVFNLIKLPLVTISNQGPPPKFS